MNNAAATTTLDTLNTRYKVFDGSDKLCGVWYARTEVDAIRAAIAERYDAWSAVAPMPEGW
jgi:hypothetical protein